ncbi:MAG: HPF/RaiA family ribosome-associated protein [Acutalibacteraceae bacterium]|jgi:putative sigma-54 modulation protein|nr:HPF/RaiA family ribosome-associated protein [Acutalibacteraceae bacterium]
MNTVIIGRKCTPKDSFKERAEQKLGKIDKLFGGEGDAKITCSVIKNKATVELTIHNNGMFYRTQATADDMSDALDQCIDMMIRKIRRNKTKLSKKLKAGNLDDYLGDAPVEEELEYDVVRHKKTAVKPQTVDEAILQMKMLGHNFYMFENGDTGEINVVYIRHNGGYGVLEPDHNY